MPIDINPQTGSDWGSFAAGLVAVLAALWAIITWPFKTFVTNKAADKKYVKRIEDDNTFLYVRPQEMIDLKEYMEKQHLETKTDLGNILNYLQNHSKI